MNNDEIPISYGFTHFSLFTLQYLRYLIVLQGAENINNIWTVFVCGFKYNETTETYAINGLVSTNLIAHQFQNRVRTSEI